MQMRHCSLSREVGLDRISKQPPSFSSTSIELLIMLLLIIAGTLTSSLSILLTSLGSSINFYFAFDRNLIAIVQFLPIF